MKNITVSDLREGIVKQLEEARARVKKLESSLQVIDAALGESNWVKSDVQIVAPQQQSLIVPAKTGGGSSSKVTNTIKDMMINAETEFNVPGIVNAIMPTFPDQEYRELSTKASNVAYRLVKKGDIQLIKEGSGREPNLYRPTKLAINNSEEEVVVNE